MLTVTFGKSAMSRTKVQLWYNRFKEGRDEVAHDVGISFGSCQAIFTDVLGMKREAMEIFLKFLNIKQKQSRINIAQEMLTTFNDDTYLLKKVITGDQSWLYGYETENKDQSSQRKRTKEPRPKKALQVRSNVKILLTAFFDCNGVMHH